MEPDLSSLTFENSYFFKRGRRVYLGTGLYDTLSKIHYIIEGAYNSIILSTEDQEMLLEAIYRDLTLDPPAISFPSNKAFVINPETSRFNALVPVIAKKINIVSLFILIIYALDLFYSRYPDIMRKYLPPEPIDGGYRRHTRRSRMRAKRARKTVGARRKRHI